MKAGNIRCNGTIQELKKEFGQGYTIKIKLKSIQSTQNETRDVPDGNITSNTIKEVKPKIEAVFENNLELIDEHSVSITLLRKSFSFNTLIFVISSRYITITKTPRNAGVGFLKN